MRIGNVEVGAGQPCRTIAEISNNHNGIKDHALALIGAAKEAGADLVKCQAYLPEELVALRGNGPAPAPWNTRSMADLYEEAQTPLAWLPDMFAQAKRSGIPLFASVFGAKSLAACEALDCPAYKISHFESENKELLALVYSTGKPVIVSAPPSHGGDMVCPGGYPALASDMKLGNYGDDWIPWWLSCHCKDPLAPVVAVARGCNLIEMHFMLSWAPSKLESNVSLTETEFRQMVESVRRTEELLG